MAQNPENASQTPEAIATHEAPATVLSASGRCVQCGKSFNPLRRWQTFCSDACRKNSFRRAKHASQPSEATATHKTPATQAKYATRGRKAKDELCCRTCGEFIDNREGWRLDCKSCSRNKMKTWHNPDRCTRLGCVVCMNATLAQSPAFIAAWENEDGGITE